jgi:hypothetical protein
MDPGEKLRKVNALRQRKRVDPAKLTGENHPPTAFVVMGHGEEETTNKKIVPEGCILVVQVHSGEVNYSTKNADAIIYNDPEKYRYLDPIANYKYITDKINIGRGISTNTPLAIYLEGDEYPEFKYTLLSFWDTDISDTMGEPNSFRLRHSGIAKYPFVEGEIDDKTIKKDVEGKEIFLNLYNKSIYPPRAEIEQIIDEMPGTKTIMDIIYSPQIENKIKINQSELFKILGKGVYYNLVCRQTGNPKLLIKQNFSNKDGWTDRLVINNNQRSLLNSSLHFRKNRPEILQAIGEAEGQRQGFIGKLNKNHAINSPQEEINIKNVLKRISTGRRKPTKINLAIIRHFQNKYYSLLKQYYEDKIHSFEAKETMNTLVNMLHSENAAQNYKENEIKRIREKLDELEKAQYGQPVTLFKNEAHELALQEQMAKQRAAHAIAVNRAAQNNVNFETAARYMAQKKPVSNTSGGKQTRKFKKYKNKTRQNKKN